MDTTTDNAGEVSQEEKIEMAKIIFASLEIDNKAKFAQWCHEEVEKGGVEFLGQKMQQMNDDFTRVVSKIHKQVVETGTKLYNGTNEMVQSALKDDEEENKSENTSEGSGIFD